MAIYKTVFCIVVFYHALLSCQPVDDLETIALRWQTDKSSISHAYTFIYETYFSPLRTMPIKFLEIGFFWGASAHTWEDYFPTAQLYFIDNNPNAFSPSKRAEFSARSHFFVGDQKSERDLCLFIQEFGRDFDVIVDDGGHTMEQQMVSFKTLFPHVKKGGLYIIEDLHTSYWAQWQGGPGDGSGRQDDGQKHMHAGRQTTIHFLKNLIDEVNYVGAQTGCANKASLPGSWMLAEYQKDIKSIHFYSSLVVIIKN